MSMRRSAAHAAVTEHNMMVADLEEAQAAIQRVRDACEPFGPMGSIAVWRVLRALDGDA